MIASPMTIPDDDPLFCPFLELEFADFEREQRERQGNPKEREKKEER